MFESDKVEKFLEEYKSIYDKYLNFIESEENVEENFMNLTQIIEDAKIKDCQHKLRLFLRIVTSIANNHHHCPKFYSKIDQTLGYFKDDIKEYFINSEIFSIFKSNRRILLFLIKEKIINVDKFFINYIQTHTAYLQYFSPEIKPFEISLCISPTFTHNNVITDIHNYNVISSIYCINKLYKNK